MCNFVHLHNHTQYSLLDGYGSVESMADRAVSIGQTALAISDHGNVHGAIAFYRACKDRNVKPIIGIEGYITSLGVPLTQKDSGSRKSHHLLLLAETQEGYQNILRLSSQSWLEGFYYRPRMDYDILEKHKDGLIVTSGCMAAEIPSIILNGGDPKDMHKLFEFYVDTFGDNFYIELQHHPGIPELVELNKKLIYYSGYYGIKMIATNDSHYASPEDHKPHDILLCIQTGSNIANPARMRFTDNEYYLKTEEEMRRDFANYGLDDSIFKNTLEIAERCNANPEYSKGYNHIPAASLVLTDYTTCIGVPDTYVSPDDLLSDLVYHHYIDNVYPDWASNKELVARIDYELEVIKKTGFASYYLIIKKICEYARKNNIQWNIRGSGTGSIICYILGMSFIDPLKNKLLFERFLNVERVTIPDLDLDFEDSRRNEIIQYLIDEFGEDSVAQVVTFGHMKARTAIRDVGRVYGYEQSYIDSLAKMVQNIPGKPITISNSLAEDSEYFSKDLFEAYTNDYRARVVIETAKTVEDKIRHTGVHAAAVIVGDKPLINYTAMMNGGSSAVTKHITQYDYPTLESIGLLKIDCLGLATLTIVNKACEMIRERHGLNLYPESIPFEGEECEDAFNLLSAGETVGVFQVESFGLRKTLMQMKPHTFQHIMDVISLYRPGPLQYIPSYIDRMHGHESIEYLHPSLKKHTEDTQGIIIYQEQIINILSDIVGYTRAEADLVRKGISKKDEKIMKAEKPKIIQGAVAAGFDQETAEQLWADIEKFTLYGFNRSHAASYARLTMQTAWLKAHFPIEFMAACLYVEGEKTDKVITYVNECRRMGINILKPRLSTSGYNFSIVPYDGDRQIPYGRYDYGISGREAIQFGFISIKNVGKDLAKLLADNHYESMIQINPKYLNRRSFEALTACGVFDDEYDPSIILGNIETVFETVKRYQAIANRGQKTLIKPVLRLDKGAAAVIDWPALEKQYMGLWIEHHPVVEFESILRDIPNRTTDINESNIGEDVYLICAVNEKKEVAVKNGTMCFLTLSDDVGICDAIIFAKDYAGIRIEEDDVILVRGKVRTVKNDIPTLIVHQIATNLTISNKYTGDTPSEFSETHEEVEPAPTLHNKFKLILDGEQAKDISSIVANIENCLHASDRTTTIHVFIDGDPRGVLRYKLSELDINQSEKHHLRAL